jgi:hypothetical protein
VNEFLQTLLHTLLPLNRGYGTLSVNPHTQLIGTEYRWEGKFIFEAGTPSTRPIQARIRHPATTRRGTATPLVVPILVTSSQFLSTGSDKSRGLRIFQGQLVCQQVMMPRARAPYAHNVRRINRLLGRRDFSASQEAVTDCPAC